MKRINSMLFSLTIIFIGSIATFAQESETKVVDEVVAQVNEGVITLSRIKREKKAIVDTYIQEGKSKEEAERLMKEKEGELIAGLINEELIIQRAKESGLDSDIEATINQRFLEIMKQQNLKTLDALYKEMEKTGIDPQDVRETWRKQATRDAVINREVQSKLYWSFTSKEIKDYYEKNKDKFIRPETVTLSEIFLGFAGREEAAVREKAKQLVTQLRGGADFTQLVLENSDRPNAAQTKGKVDSFAVKDLDEKFASAIRSVKVGGVTEPIEVDQVGINILRVDERVAASSESKFDENAVRLAMLREKIPEEQRKYFAQLREDAYIKISDTYRPIVAPLLFADERKSKPDKQ